MATTMLPPQAPMPEPHALELLHPHTVMVRANLLPQDIVDKRRLSETKRVMAIGLAVLVVLLVAWYGFAMLQTRTRRSRTSRRRRKQRSPCSTSNSSSARSSLLKPNRRPSSPS